MHRPGWAGSSRVSEFEADLPRQRGDNYSSKTKGARSLLQRLNLLLTRQSTLQWLGLAFFVLILVGLVAGLEGWHGRHPRQLLSFAQGTALPAVTAHYQGELDLLIQQTELEAAQLAAELPLAKRHWDGLQLEVADKAHRARKAQEEHDTLARMLEQRLAALASGQPLKDGHGKPYPASVDRNELKREWQAQVDEAEKLLRKAQAMEADARRRDLDQRQLYEVMVSNHESKLAALDGYKRQRASMPGMGASDGEHVVVQPADPGAQVLAGILGGDLAAMADQGLLAHAEAEHAQQAQQHPATVDVQRLDPDLQRQWADLNQPEGHASLPQELVLPSQQPGSGAQQQLGLKAMPGAATDPKVVPSAQEQRHAAYKAKALDPFAVVQIRDPVSNVTLEERLAALMASKAELGAESLSSSLLKMAIAERRAQAVPARDDSVRCRMSGICEGRSACTAAGDLGCITDNSERQTYVRAAAEWSWKGYKQYAWGADELLPVSGGSGEWFNLGLTLVDALDTLALLGMDEAFAEARAWVADSLKLDQDKDVNLFETTIRVLGGLLAAFHLADGDQLFLHKAHQLALRLSPAFDSPSGIPFSDVNLGTGAVSSPGWSGGASSLSEVSTLSVEFSYLARIAGNKVLADQALKVVEQIRTMPGKTGGLAPILVNPHTGSFEGGIITLGARGDSYYEYLLKQWLISGKVCNTSRTEYKVAMRGVRDQLLDVTRPEGGLLFVGELHGGARQAKMDHLVCFLPGLLALGHLHGINSGNGAELDDLALARLLMLTCYEMYRRIPTGLAPEIAFFKPLAGGDYPKHHSDDVGSGDFVVKPQDAHNLLRPETMESLFVMWRVTRDAKYQEWGWHIFRAFEKFCKVDGGGYTNLDNVLQVPPTRRDKMESFWLAETLKYLYLLLDGGTPDLLPLDEYVFNTEAHPLPIVGTVPDVEASDSYWLGRFPASNASGKSLQDVLQVWEAREKEALNGASAGDQAEEVTRNFREVIFNA